MMHGDRYWDGIRNLVILGVIAALLIVAAVCAFAIAAVGQWLAWNAFGIAWAFSNVFMVAHAFCFVVLGFVAVLYIKVK